MSGSKNLRRLYLDRDEDFWVVEGYLPIKGQEIEWCMGSHFVLSFFNPFYVETFTRCEIQQMKPAFLLPLEEFLT